jgi:hypothetical protein
MVLDMKNLYYWMFYTNDLLNSIRDYGVTIIIIKKNLAKFGYMLER